MAESLVEGAKRDALHRRGLAIRISLLQLQRRGMTITDQAIALDYLERIGYYRLSGYWYPFRERSGEVILLSEQGRKPQKIKTTRVALEHFKAGSRFIDAVELYVRQATAHVGDGCAGADRNRHSCRYFLPLGQLDPFAYLKPECLFAGFSQQLDESSGVSKHHDWLGNTVIDWSIQRGVRQTQQTVKE